MSTTAFEIPLQSGPQILSITLSGVAYQLTVWWNNQCQSWMVDIADTNGNPILTGIPLVTGADLLEQFAYLDFGGQLVCQTQNDPDAVPTFANLGTTGNLYWIVDD
jgi:hypothetical protein